MNIQDMQLMDLLHVDPKTGIIHLMGNRVLINDSISEGLLRRELIQTFGKYGAKSVLTRYGYAHGWRTAEMLKTRMPELLYGFTGGAQLHKLYGLFITTELDGSDGTGTKPLIHSIIEYSFEAEQHLLNFGKADEPSCWMLTGFASGYESYKHGRDVYFIETKCKAKGDSYCEIEGRFADKWGDSIKEQLPFYGMASANDILTELTSRILHTEKKLKKTQVSLKTLESKRHAMEGLVIRSKSMIDLIALADRTARVDTSVLITGESGVGKEVLARYVHNCSPRSAKPFIAVNCGAFSDSLLESELFGHTKGAFTGAEREHKGLFEEAEGGTLFLDEIGETSPSMQVKLLRVLQEKEIKRVGENNSRKINVRILSATNKNLENEIGKGNFRRDLFYRLRVIELKIAPLRERNEDILPLSHSFLRQATQEMKTKVTGFSHSASQILLEYGWPGNVRELRNVIQRAAALCETEIINASDLPQEMLGHGIISGGAAKFKPLEEIEKEYIRTALETSGWNRKTAADKLGIGIATLYRKMKLYGIKQK